MADSLNTLLTTLCNERTKVLLITGDTGIGKTTFAYKLFMKTEETRKYRQRFETKVAIRPYMQDWEHFITKLARAILADNFMSKANIAELESKIFEFLSKHKYLLLVDDADQVQPEKLEAFIRKWATNDHHSTLLLTVRSNPFGQNIVPEGCFEHKMSGLTDEPEVRQLMGEELVGLVDESDMWDAVKELGNNPQKLLFLRWRALKDKNSLKDCIQELKTDTDGSTSVESIIHRMPYPLSHFLALGRVRDPEFDESLLAFLWDRLGGGSTESYVQALELLLDEKLISIEKVGSRRIFRLSAGVHMGLSSPLRNHIGEERISHVDYFISEYYRNRFSAVRNRSFGLQHLERYAYHALQSGNFEGAYAYVFESDILDAAHHFGLSLELEPILHNFREAWLKLKDIKQRKGITPDAKYAEQGCRINIEVGRIYKDLSQHNKCLFFMGEANDILRKPYAASLNEELKRSLQRRIWHYMAISNSQLGRNIECLHYYLRIVQDSVERQKFTAFDALSLGYLAYELKFQNIELAERLGREALRLSQELKEPNTIVKNMSSLGQTLFFRGKYEEGEIIFNDARELCEHPINNKVDRREEGRILINSVGLCIATNKFKQAGLRLDEGLSLNRQFGDRRRAATGLAYKAILLHRLGKDGAPELLLEAIRQHAAVESWRELVNEALTYVWLIDSSFEGDIEQAETRTALPEEVLFCLRHINSNPHLGIFVNFWINNFKPSLLLSNT
jgi:tetratricopeptide (TPR) repeat protein